MEYAGQKKITREIEKKIKIDISISDETKAKKDKKRKLLYYHKLQKPKN
jgi:hypothetical protein